jgi:hypothetical protein
LIYKVIIFFVFVGIANLLKFFDVTGYKNEAIAIVRMQCSKGDTSGPKTLDEITFYFFCATIVVGMLGYITALHTNNGCATLRQLWNWKILHTNKGKKLSERFVGHHNCSEEKNMSLLRSFYYVLLFISTDISPLTRLNIFGL